MDSRQIFGLFQPFTRLCSIRNSTKLSPSMEKNIWDSKMGFEPADLGVLSNLLSQLESVGKFQSRQGFLLDCLVILRRIPKLFHQTATFTDQLRARLKHKLGAFESACYPSSLGRLLSRIVIVYMHWVCWRYLQWFRQLLRSQEVWLVATNLGTTGGCLEDKGQDPESKRTESKGRGFKSRCRQGFFT